MRAMPKSNSENPCTTIDVPQLAFAESLNPIKHAMKPKNIDAKPK